MDEQEEAQQNNMISNLPLLFANGYPTSLEKITEKQLENFIPFMVQCSLGHINLQGKVDCSEPEWWPEDLPFIIPFTKPKKFSGNWMEKMKEVVIICYQFHKSVFLLRFCNDLASYEHASLRFINNYNSTTSLFDRRSNKLLVTFRNENMAYDQPQRSRKCLLQQKSKNGRPTSHDLQQIMVEPAPFDIYLCDNCDAELYSTEAILEHEKTCIVDDDVILCDTPDPQQGSEQLDNFSQSSNENNELRIGFLLNFNLECRSGKKPKKVEFSESSSGAKNDVGGFMILDQNKRMPRRNRAVHSLTRCPTIPLSSPAGQLLLRTTKTLITPEYLAERLDRMERFCHAPLLSKLSNKPRYFEKKHASSNPHCTFKKPQECSSHIYVFPRRQFSQRRRTENFLFLNSPLIRRCRPISVRLKKITEHEMKGRRTALNTNLNIKLTRDTTRSSNWKISSQSTENILDTIDLCSTDDEDDNHKNADSSLDVGQQAAAIKKTGSQTSPIRECFSRRRLKKNCNQLNAPEVSLIPIRKALSNCAANFDKVSLNSSLIKLIPNSGGETSSVIKSNAKNHYEGNLLLSSPAAVPESNITLAKPLRPSLYIFSNYPSLTAIVAKPNDTVSSSDESNFCNHNQENHIQCSPTTTQSSVSDWYTGANILGSNSHSSSSSNQILTSDKDRSTKNLPLVQSYGSPNRVVSIDLTS